MKDLIYVGPRKRTERTAKAEAERMVNDWWARLGYPDHRVRAVAATRKRDRSWTVEVERIP